ncbi:MAG: serine hydrolase [Bacteroidota bacterium]
MKWDQALRENKLINQASLEKAFSTYKTKNGKETGYGYGQFVVNADQNEKIVYHGGSWPGYQTFILHCVDAQTMIAILSNNERTDIEKLADQLALIILSWQ